MGQLADNALLTDTRSKALTQRLLDHETALLAKLAKIRAMQDEVFGQLDAFDGKPITPSLPPTADGMTVTSGVANTSGPTTDPAKV